MSGDVKNNVSVVGTKSDWTLNRCRCMSTRTMKDHQPADLAARTGDGRYALHECGVSGCRERQVHSGAARTTTCSGLQA